MGILFVLVLLAVPVSALAGLAFLVIRFLAWRVLPGSLSPSESRTVRRVALLPFGALLWLGFVFLVHWTVNDAFFDRDAGLGDSSRCPLINGYTLAAIDDDWMIEPPNSDQSVVAGITRMQVAAPFLFVRFGNRDAIAADDESSIRRAVLDTRNAAETIVDSEEALRRAAAARGVTLDLQSVDTIYWRNRFSLFDALTAIVALAPITIVLFAFVRSLQDHRHARRLNAPLGSGSAPAS